MKSPRRILIVRTDRLGDVVLTLPMARAIKIAMPDANVGFYCREYTLPIVERCPDVDETIVRPQDSSIIDDARAMRHGNWDAVFIPNARPGLALAAWLARIPVRVGTGYRFYSSLFNRRIKDHRKTAERHEAVYNLRMLSAIGLSADPTLLPAIVLNFAEIEQVERWKRNVHLAGKYAVLHMGSGGSSHTWRASKWVELAKSLDGEFGVVLTGADSERAQIEDVTRTMIAAGIHPIHFIGHTLPELAALLSSADLVVSGSTGPGHLAAALGTRTIGLFPLPRPLSKERWGFRGPRAVNISPAPKPDCPNCTECVCMERLSSDIVADSIS